MWGVGEEWSQETQLGGQPRGEEMRREGEARRQGGGQSPAELFTTAQKPDRVPWSTCALPPGSVDTKVKRALSQLSEVQSLVWETMRKSLITMECD